MSPSTCHPWLLAAPGAQFERLQSGGPHPGAGAGRAEAAAPAAPGPAAPGPGLGGWPWVNSLRVRSNDSVAMVAW